MREANAQGTRDPGRELMAVIRPYLEILKVHGERLHWWRSAIACSRPSFRHDAAKFGGRTPSARTQPAEGGSLTVSAEIVHGKLAVTVADAGLGFGKAAKRARASVCPTSANVWRCCMATRPA